MPEGSFFERFINSFKSKPKAKSETDVISDKEKLKIDLDRAKKILDEVNGTGLNSNTNPFVDEIETSQTINGIPVSVIEQRMRPNMRSNAGFLGEDEKLVDVLKKDQETVNSLGLTHKEIVRPLEDFNTQYVLKSVENPDWAKTNTKVTINGKDYRMEAQRWFGPIVSPLLAGGDNGDWRKATNSEIYVTLTDEKKGKSRSFSPLAISLIRDYGFYQGNTPYRVSPEEIVDFFDLKK